MARGLIGLVSSTQANVIIRLKNAILKKVLLRVCFVIVMASVSTIGVADYAVVGASLVIPVLIGLRFGSTNAHQGSAGDYFLAGRKASMFPVVMSTTVTIMSGILMLGVPAETYKFGPTFINSAISTCFGQIAGCFVFIPVYFRCGVSSVYELLEMRFGKYTRYAISAVFIIQTVLYMCTVLLGPVLALNAVTDFSMEMAIITFGAVCTFYCVLGGLKAVLWTDVFQAGLMFTCFIIMYAVGISEVGGLTEVTKRAAAGQRLTFFESILWSVFPVFFLQASGVLLGVFLYAVFYLCDPVLMLKEAGLTKYDQLVPYFIVSRLHSFPGMTGLCIAGIFSGSLSTMSSALNSLATVTVIDFIQPLFSRLTDVRTVSIAKILGLLYGVLCIGLTFAIAKIDSILQAGVIFLGFTEGPVLAIFLIGVLTRKATDKSTILGLLVGIGLVSWIGFGSLFSGYRYPHQLPLETSGCPAYFNMTSDLLSNSTEMISTYSNCNHETITKNRESFALYRMPFLWIPPIGCLVTIASVLIFSLLLEGNKNVIPPDSKCLSPVVRYWMNTSTEQETKQNGQEMKSNSKIKTPNLQKELGCDQFIYN